MSLGAVIYRLSQLLVGTVSVVFGCYPSHFRSALETLGIPSADFIEATEYERLFLARRTLNHRQLLQVLADLHGSGVCLGANLTAIGFAVIRWLIILWLRMNGRNCT
tara:strand:- start:387 stop:707 length:321 start_codon:yes stop_codon:yes gene_type:complete